MRWIWMVMVVACSGGSGGGGSETADTGSPVGDCASLDVEACESEADCEVIEGVPTGIDNVDPSDPNSDSCWFENGDPEPMGCKAADEVCPAEVILGGPELGDSDPWVFYAGCLPFGFERVGVDLEECPTGS